MACDSPISINPKDPKCKIGTIPVPCGQCPACKMTRIRQWAFRLLQEANVCTSVFFVTLTYDTNHVPISDNNFMTLDKDDWRYFMKRLRRKQETKIKYYACGEYGSRTNRPHFHAILFNVEDPSYIFSAWKLGTVHIGETFESGAIAYCAKYIDKPSRIPMHKNDDRVPEFSRMSKNLGISYVHKWKKWHRADMFNRIYCTFDDGHKVAMPRYYREKIWNEYERALQAAYIAKAVAAEDTKARYHFDTFVKVDDGKDSSTLNDYDAYKQSQRLGRHAKFYKNQKPRDAV